jgi:hypothetical protein
MAWLREIPLIWAIVVTVAMYGVMIGWAWLRPAKFIYAGAPDKKGWRDLRIWATILMMIQILIYATCGI